jgi:ABC-type bacteriocin/lantibiotic exporter with double-glycine peptidase domain
MLLNLSHLRQRQPADCLAVCAEMVLQYLQIPVSHGQLLRLLQTTNEGTFFSQLDKLRARGLWVTMGDNGDLALFEQYLALGLPVIVAVRTEWLLYWQDVASLHAVVVVGIDTLTNLIYLNDPASTESPQVVTLNEFEAAWTETERQYAVIGLAPP